MGKIPIIIYSKKKDIVTESKKKSFTLIKRHTHTHAHIYVCVCVFIEIAECLSLNNVNSTGFPILQSTTPTIHTEHYGSH